MLLMLLSSTSAHKGRPQRHTIVQPSELRPVEAIANLPELTSRNIADFIGNIDGTEESDEAALRFLATYGLVLNERECPECLNASLHGVTTSTIVNLNKLFRQLTEQWFERQIEKNPNFLLGGPGKIVEIDESHMYKAKYNRGHMLRRKSIWIFGMTERHTNKVAMFRVKQRDAATLLPIIRAHVKPGSMIVSDDESDSSDPNHGDDDDEDGADSTVDDNNGYDDDDDNNGDDDNDDNNDYEDNGDNNDDDDYDDDDIQNEDESEFEEEQEGEQEEEQDEEQDEEKEDEEQDEEQDKEQDEEQEKNQEDDDSEIFFLLSAPYLCRESRLVVPTDELPLAASARCAST
ncbi:hypothetical protein L5515_017260 [Caenorhabditis briggsae]|uniref:ISXO2-like transposase domain-containing protein n=1 Tax=Caenorhabditis briggsae TaxID=6238 RepID=A0AAE9F846_CAEBR|nr:hypothetical protein L5515_017260 [Caenorhabditis briggsae]